MESDHRICITNEEAAANSLRLRTAIVEARLIHLQRELERTSLFQVLKRRRIQRMVREDEAKFSAFVQNLENAQIEESIISASAKL